MARLPLTEGLVRRAEPLVRFAPKRADSFYLTPEWRALVRRVKERRGGWCERCGSTHRVAADHVIERRDGGADFDEANIELLCARCHAAKTARARARRARGG